MMLVCYKKNNNRELIKILEILASILIINRNKYTQEKISNNRDNINKNINNHY